MSLNGTKVITKLGGTAIVGEVSNSLDFAYDLIETTVKGVSGIAEVASLTVTGAATAAGNITVTLDSVAVLVAVALSDTAIQVATKIRAAVFAGWTTGGTAGTAIVTFTASAAGLKTDAAYSAGTTGATGTMTTTTQGTADSSGERSKTYETGENGMTLSVEAKVAQADGAAIVALQTAAKAGTAQAFIVSSSVIGDLQVVGNALISGLSVSNPQNDARTVTYNLTATGTFAVAVIAA